MGLLGRTLLAACIGPVLGIGSLIASEKYSIAVEAKLILVGRLLNPKLTGSMNGWRLSGFLSVAEVIRSDTSPLPPPERYQNVVYDFECTCCQNMRLSEVDYLTRSQGLWFLQPGQGGKWTTAGNCSDPGWRHIRERSDYEHYLRQYQESKRRKGS
jgi:hypothetical protein